MPQSAHPPNMAKGIITSLLRIYYKQNTKIADYEAIAILLFHRWLQRGWSRVDMEEYILQANIKIRRERQQTPTTAPTTIEPLTNKEQVFIHWEYHQCNIPKHVIRALYNIHLKDDMDKWLDIKQTAIATPGQKTNKTT